jgi:predicted kinase
VRPASGPVRDPRARGPSGRTFYLVVRGPLGAGKTTVARAVASAEGAEVVSIDAILESFEWDGGSEALFLRANGPAVEQARSWLDRGIPVVFDGNFYWASVIDDLADRLPGLHEVVTLRAPIEQCIERDRRRPLSYGAAATREVFDKVARVDRGVSIDASGTREETVAAVRQQLRDRGFGGHPR